MYIIVGQGAAGTTAAKELRRREPATPVTMITNEDNYFYSRIDLPDIIAGKYAPSASALMTAEDFSRLEITCRMGETVSKIDPDKKTVILRTGERLAYTKLLVATGSLPVVPPLPGREACGIYTVWTMRQAEIVGNAAENATNAVVIGAGLIGLKTALALKKRGLKVTIVERLPRVMPRQIDGIASLIITESLRKKGVDVMVDTEVKGIAVKNDQVVAVELAGQKLLCDLVIMAVGVQPNIELAKTAGIAVERGIIVNSAQETSVKDIYAAGDVVQSVDKLTGKSVIPAIWPVAVEQGEVAAANMTGARMEFGGSVAMNSVEIAGVPLVSVGDIEGEANDQVIMTRRGSNYRKVIIRENKIRGVLVLGDIRYVGVIGAKVIKGDAFDNTFSFTSGTLNMATVLGL